ncbi:MAG: PKD domain-containing protein [Bacteriovoracia bacterium]
MKKYLFAALALSFFATSAFASGDKTNNAAYKLIKSFKHTRKVRKLEQAPIVKFMPSPSASVEQGTEFSIFIAPLNSYTDSNILLNATIDNAPVGLIHSSPNLWIYHSSGFSEQRSHDLTIGLAIERKDLANQIRTSVDRLSKEIFELQQKIDVETDPVKKATFTSQRDEKIAIKNELIRQLAELKTPVANQTFTFNVVPAASNAAYPRLTAISPQVGSASGGNQIVISGENFVPGMTVRIGGLSASASLVNATTITAVAPSFGSLTGIKDLEVRFPPLSGSTEVRNSFLRNAYFVTNSSLENNVQPVAVAGPHHSFLLGSDMSMDGTGSYDPNPGTTLSYEWKVVDAPLGSGLTVGQVISTEIQPHLTLTAAGYYIFELKVREINTSDHLVSEPSLTTIEVVGPTNHAPAPSAPPVTTVSNIQGTTTVAPNDADGNQSWTFSVVSAPTHGTASVSLMGVVYYNATAGYSGSDSITVRVTDSGAPSLSGDVIIPVTVSAENQAPVPSAPSITVSSNTGTSQVAANDLDVGQTHTYAIVVNPLHGTASVNSSGLVTFNAATTYEGSDSLKVRVTDNGSPAKSGEVTIAITIPNRPPVLGPSFSFVRSQGSPTTMRIANVPATDSDGSIVQWTIDFGDGRPVETFPSSVFTPGTAWFVSALHDYQLPGSYTATITAKDNKGATTSTTTTVVVTDKAVPVAKISPNKITGTFPLTVVFDASETTSLGGTPEYRWLFENAEEVTSSPIRSHTFNTPGQFNVRLRVRDPNGGEGEASVRIYVGVNAPAAGTASTFSAALLPGREILVGTPMTFDAYGSFNPNPGGTIDSYEWQTNDGFFDCLTNPGGPCNFSGVTGTHTYSYPFNHFPTLLVTSSAGEEGYLGWEIYVVATGHSPRAVSSVQEVSGVVPFAFNADALASYDVAGGTITSYKWRYEDYDACPSDGCVDESEYASHTYANPGVYFPNLEVHDDEGNVHVAYVPVTVNEEFKIKVKREEDSEDPARKAKRKQLSGACATKNAPACYFLGKMYQEDGDAFGASKLFEKSCGLGYAPACSAR